MLCIHTEHVLVFLKGGISLRIISSSLRYSTFRELGNLFFVIKVT